MNIAVVGYGSIARAHLAAIKALAATPEWADLRCYGVMGRLREPTTAFAQEFGATLATTDFSELLADPAIDTVIICSPSDAHAVQTAQALQAGKHVLCEIPLALSLTDTDRLIALADQVDRRLMVCHTQRYFPALIEARRRIATGALHPHAIVSRYMFGRRENINWQGRQRSWTDNLLWHHGCHAIDAALWLLGVTERQEAVDVAAQVALPGVALQIPMDLTATLRTARDQLVTVAMSYSIRFPVHDYLIIGEEETILFDDGVLRDAEQIIVPRAAEDGLSAPIPQQDREFFSAIREHREPAISGRAVRATMATLQAVQDTLDAHRAAVGPAAEHPQWP